MSASAVGDNRRVKRLSPFVVYTSARLVLFIVTATILALFGMHGIGLLMLALVVSGLLSYVLLTRLRDAVSEAVSERVGARSRGDRPARARGLAGLSRRLDERTRAEDEADDARRAAEEAAAERADPEHDPEVS
jgi:Protein of unknown function (DUF4229)